MLIWFPVGVCKCHKNLVIGKTPTATVCNQTKQIHVHSSANIVPSASELAALSDWVPTINYQCSNLEEKHNQTVEILKGKFVWCMCTKRQCLEDHTYVYKSSMHVRGFWTGPTNTQCVAVHTCTQVQTWAPESAVQIRTTHPTLSISFLTQDPPPFWRVNHTYML